MSADGDTVREALKAHDLTAGATSIDAEHDPACRHCAALAALGRMEAEREEFRQEAIAANKSLWKARAHTEETAAQRDTLAEALRRIKAWRGDGNSIARDALAEAGMEP